MSDERADLEPRDGPEPSASVGGTEADPRPRPPVPPVPREPRPLIERLGLAAVAVVLATLFGGVAAASWVGGEPFLAVMGAVGCAMTIWVGALTLLRG
jgi:hypothetical protein